jgi:uncharacterized membrane protein YgcG
VPLRPYTPNSDEPAEGAETSNSANASANGARPPLAVDFWGGVTAPDELVPLPSSAAGPAPQTNGSDPARVKGPAKASVLVGWTRGRRAAAVLAVLFFGLVAVRALSSHSSTGRTGAQAETLAQAGHWSNPVGSAGRVTDFRDEPRAAGARGLATTHGPRPGTHKRRVVKHRHPEASSSGSQTSHGQPVAYSPPPPTQNAVSSSGSTESSSESDGGSGGAGSGSSRGVSGPGTSGGSSKPGPTGPGAPFGPGRLGK